MQVLKRFFGRTDEPKCTYGSPRQVFEQARALAASENARNLVMVLPNLSIVELACPAKESLPKNIIDHAESILSSKLRRNIASISMTVHAGESAKAEVGSAVWNKAGEVIPFFGLLNSLACIGHSVWTFDANTDIEAACQAADMLIIDSEMTGLLTEDRIAAARRVMRGSTVLVHDRATYGLRPLSSEEGRGGEWAPVFDTVRVCTNQHGRSQIVMVRPDKSLLFIPCIPRTSMTSDQLTQAHRLIPEGAPRNVVVIAPTELNCDAFDDSASAEIARLRAAGHAVPFFGLLLSLASAGNPLWIFEGQMDAVLHGCRQADLLFVDSILADKLTTKTLDEAVLVMRSGNVAVYDRKSRKIGLIRHVGPTQDKLEFRD